MNRRVAGDLFDEVRRIDPIEKLDAPLGEAPLPIDAVDVSVAAVDGAIHITATVAAHWRTGVEMEALAAVSAAALTVYDMTKAIDKSMTIDGVRLLEKRGGRSGDWTATSE